MLIAADISTKLRNASDFVDLCAAFGYTAEEHIVQTGDGYLLGLHRLAYKKGEENEKVNYGKKSIRKSVVYMHHGLLMNSEVWVCLTEEERCLPFKLVEKGYDVWVSRTDQDSGVMLTQLVGQQSRKQVLQEVCPSFANRYPILGLLNGRIRIP